MALIQSRFIYYAILLGAESQEICFKFSQTIVCVACSLFVSLSHSFLLSFSLQQVVGVGKKREQTNENKCTTAKIMQQKQ